MNKKLVLLISLIAVALLLSGCTEFDQPISDQSEGFWNEFIVWPLVSTIKFFKGLLGTYGFGIIAVTIIIRLVMLPLMIKQTKSSKRMQEVQPELVKLKEKYKSKDAVTQQKYQKEMMALFQERGVNPMAGCLPVLIQMPVLIGFYHAISRMNNTPEIDLGSFLIFPLAEPSIILAVIAGLMQFVVLRTGPAMDNPQMKIMMYFMPVMIIGFGIVLPSALTLYWVIGNVISLIQNLVIYRPWEKKETQQPVKTKAGGAKK
ncbi:MULTISPECIES: membrane protein insertase YidC [Planococcus]|uniref:Membrane protein insertase YidC n=2 Tax=Planococcus TaxID=1372 RepID=A0ABN4JQK1_9BACL|nr:MULTISPECIES: membrane protein insertase YidC [Planococcus]ALS77171.1 OxaA precursor [Planococcus kocurii]AQU80944.1 OxaA precursor [Planococcus faecalis]KAA0956286.1 membrane protein insertase YidC [Planococcus sp. ANT_H30]MDJ0333339.1 membrane protein insertase YidC [Planococcus sp. S3-L1]OHX55912.1 OxaA precursor [Planococcus faecalis]